MQIGEQPIRTGKIRNGVYWKRYKNGCINIQGHKFFDYSIKEAVSIWRQNNPLN